MSVSQMSIPPGVARNMGGRTLRHLWPYLDEDGQVFGYVARYDDAEGGKSVIPYFRRNGAGWKSGAEPAPRRLFGLHTLRGDRVFVVEGEKCAAALHSLGLAAVTSPCGSHSAHNADWTLLARFSEVYIPRDNDEAGLHYARSVASILNGLPGSRKVHVCEFPDLPEKGDVVDWLMSRVPGWDGFEPIPREPGDDLLDELLEELTRQSQSIPPDWLGNDAWPQPIPLRPYEPPPWPGGAFPADIEEYVNSLSEATETPVELAACVVLAILATCVQGKYAVKIKDGYYEPLCLWTSCALPSGSRKSAVHSSAVTPLITWERSQRERIEPEIKRLESETETILARIKKLRGKAAEPANENPQNIQKQIEELEASLPLIPIVPRVWASDITPEHLGTLMAQQEGRMALLCDEAGILETIGGRYANGIPNLDLFLQGHSGTPVRVDRGSRPSVSIDKPALSVALMPQPVVIHALANKSEFRGRGLLARFLYTMPDHNLGFRTGDKPPVPDRVVQRYATIIVALLNRKGRASGNGTESPHILSLAPEAYDRWKDLSAELEKEMADGGKYEHLRDWAGKLPGAAGRIAAIFHVTRYAFENERNHLISLEEMEAATELARVFCKHALIAFDEMGADRTRDDARSILGWIRREKCASFSKRDVQRALQCTFKKSEDIDGPLAILADRHYIRQINEAKKPAGGRPREKYEVNPDVFQVSEKP